MRTHQVSWRREEPSHVQHARASVQPLHGLAGEIASALAQSVATFRESLQLLRADQAKEEGRNPRRAQTWGERRGTAMGGTREEWHVTSTDSPFLHKKFKAYTPSIGSSVPSINAPSITSTTRFPAARTRFMHADLRSGQAMSCTASRATLSRYSRNL